MKFRTPQGKLTLDFAIYWFGIFVISCAHYALLNLQSSLNVEDGLGSISVTVQYSCMVVGGLFASSNLLHFIDIKTGLVISDIAYIAIIAGNFYPTFYTLIPVNVIGGFGKSLFFVTAGQYTVYFAKNFEKFGTREYKDYVGDIGAFTLCAIQLSQIIGSLIQFVVFETAPDTEHDVLPGDNMTTSITITTPRPLSVGDICAANDCQDPEITKRNISNYIPLGDATLYTMLGVYLGLNIFGLLLHIVRAPRSDNEYDINRNELETKAAHNNPVYKDDNKDTIQVKTPSPQNVDKNSSKIMKPSENFSLKKVKNELVATVVHCLKLQQLLLTMFVFHQGMLVGFTTGELTRAYVSCVFGVTQIGVAMSIQGACAFIISLFYGRILGKFSRILPFIGAIALDLAYITFALLWVPNENSQTWEVYLLLGVGGLGVGTASALTYYFVPVFFPNDTARGFASWTLWTGMGNLVQYAWSTSVCVRYKIYTLYATTALSVITHVIAEIRHKRKQRKLIMKPELTESESQSKFTKL